MEARNRAQPQGSVSPVSAFAIAPPAAVFTWPASPLAKDVRFEQRCRRSLLRPKMENVFSMRSNLLQPPAHTPDYSHSVRFSLEGAASGGSESKELASPPGRLRAHLPGREPAPTLLKSCPGWLCPPETGRSWPEETEGRWGRSQEHQEGGGRGGHSRVNTEN